MSIPFIHQFDFAYGRADRLSALVTRVICNNPGPFTFTGSGTYLIGTEILAIIDPGPDNEGHLSALIEAIDARPVSHILITHTHLDHCGGARALAAKTGAAIYGFGTHPTSSIETIPALDEGGDFDFKPDATLQHGSSINGPDWTLTALHTPGHIGNHICFSLAQDQALFTGDHVMGWATTVVTPPDGSLTDYLVSLTGLLDRADIIYYPTHGAPILEPKKLVQAILDHRHTRDQQILRELKRGSRNIMEIVAVIYADVDKALHLAAGLNVHAHLEAHLKTGLVAFTGDKLFTAIWSLK